MKNESLAKDARVIGYVRTTSRDQLFVTNQGSRIENFANREGLEIAQVEHEASNGNSITRAGLFKALRMMICLACEPKLAPMTDDYSYWIREAMKPCSCNRPQTLDGLIVEDITIISPNPPIGTKFLLDMCVAKKHLYSVKEKGCTSCCNPKAVEFVRKQLMKDS